MVVGYIGRGLALRLAGSDLLAEKKLARHGIEIARGPGESREESVRLRGESCGVVGILCALRFALE